MKLNKQQQAKLGDIRKRVKDMFSRHAEDIKDGAFIRMTGLVIEEMRFLLEIVDDKVPATEDEDAELANA